MEKQVLKENFTKYEKTRVLGARALQVAMNAPLLKDINKEELERLNYNPMEIAELELNSGVLPISVKQPMPKKKSVKIIKKVEEKVEDKEVVQEEEKKEEQEIAEKGEIMELATPEDEEVQEEPEGREASEELR